MINQSIIKSNFNLGFLTSTLLFCKISSLYVSISKFQGKQKSSKFEAKLSIRYFFSIYYTFDSTIFSDLFDDRYSSISNYFIMLRSILKIPSNSRHSDHSFTFDRTARLIIHKFTCRHRGFFSRSAERFREMKLTRHNNNRRRDSQSVTRFTSTLGANIRTGRRDGSL